MTSEEKERTTFKMRPEVGDSRIGCLKFTVKCGIELLSGGKQRKRKEVANDGKPVAEGHRQCGNPRRQWLGKEEL